MSYVDFIKEHKPGFDLAVELLERMHQENPTAQMSFRDAAFWMRHSFSGAMREAANAEKAR